MKLKKYCFLGLSILSVFCSANSDNTAEFFYQLASEGNTAQIRKMKREGLDINTPVKNYFKETALHIAAREGDIQAARILLNQGADIEAQNYGGYTPVHWAAIHGQPEMIDFLALQGAHLNKYRYNNYPLGDAVRIGHSQSVRTLLKRGAMAVLPLSAVYVQSPLHIAAEQGDPEIISMLVDAGANPNSIIGGQTPLHIAVSKGHFTAVKKLVDLGAGIYEKRGMQFPDTPLDIARYLSKQSLQEIFSLKRSNKIKTYKRIYSFLKQVDQKNKKQIKSENKTPPLCRKFIELFRT